MATWNIKTNRKWYMIQWCWDGWVSFGIHIDFKQKTHHKTKEKYAPYIDIHILWFIFSFGYNPHISNEYGANAIGRGGDIIDFSD